MKPVYALPLLVGCIGKLPPHEVIATRRFVTYGFVERVEYPDATCFTIGSSGGPRGISCLAKRQEATQPATSVPSRLPPTSPSLALPDL
jgi:hypothetical protein